MNETIKFWLEYIGGINIIWLILTCTAFTQLFKMLLDAFKAYKPDRIRPFPYVVGSFLGLNFIEFNSRGALVGMAAGMVSSIMFYATIVFLERESSPDWQKKIASRLQLK